MKIIKDVLSVLSMGGFVICIVIAFAHGASERIPIALLWSLISLVFFAVAIALKDQENP